jgi:cold shock CspA family protein
VSDGGFGFIMPEDRASDRQGMFFRRNDVQGDVPFEQLRVGARVEYDLGRDERRGTPKANNVRSSRQP